MMPMMAVGSAMNANTEIPVGAMDISYKTVVTFSIG
jgi:hypothetical protein